MGKRPPLKVSWANPRRFKPQVPPPQKGLKTLRLAVLPLSHKVRQHSVLRTHLNHLLWRDSQAFLSLQVSSIFSWLGVQTVWLCEGHTFHCTSQLSLFLGSGPKVPLCRWKSSGWSGDGRTYHEDDGSSDPWRDSCDGFPTLITEFCQRCSILLRASMLLSWGTHLGAHRPGCGENWKCQGGWRGSADTHFFIIFDQSHFPESLITG